MIKNIVDPKKYYDKVKPLSHPKSVDEFATLYERQQNLLNSSFDNKNENWFEKSILPLWGNKRFHFQRQYLFGKRIFDFFNDLTGCAIEIDGPEHDFKYDRYRDISVYIYEAIVVYRIRNRNEEDLREAIRCIYCLESWDQRKAKLKISRAASKVKHKIPKHAKRKKFKRPTDHHKSDKEINRLKKQIDNI